MWFTRVEQPCNAVYNVQIHTRIGTASRWAMKTSCDHMWPTGRDQQDNTSRHTDIKMDRSNNGWQVPGQVKSNGYLQDS